MKKIFLGIILLVIVMSIVLQLMILNKNTPAQANKAIEVTQPVVVKEELSNDLIKQEDIKQELQHVPELSNKENENQEIIYEQPIRDTILSY